MGNYNRQYENYYSRLNNKSHDTSPKFERNLGKNSKKPNRKEGGIKGNTIKYFGKELITSSLLSGCIFFSFFGMKYSDNEFANSLCEKFKSILSTDNYYKELALEDSTIVGALSRSIDEFGMSEEDLSGNKSDFIDDNTKANESLNKDSEKNSSSGNYALHKGKNEYDNKKLDEKGEKKVDEDERNKSEDKNKVESFSGFSVIKKTSLDLLNESSVVAFKGEVKELDLENIEKPNIYISGEKGDVFSLIKGVIKDIEKNKNTFKVTIEHEDKLQTIYHNLDKVNKKEGEEINKNEVLGESASGEIKGIIIQVLLENKYLNPKEHLSFLGDNISEDK